MSDTKPEEAPAGDPEKRLCFIIGPIGKENSKTRRLSDRMHDQIVRKVLTKPPFSFTVLRADENSDPAQIASQVFSDILRADLIVADLSELNANVFYELGVCHCLQKRTILIARNDTKVPFDLSIYRTIIVDLVDPDNCDRARQTLADAVRTVMQPGYTVINPVLANPLLALRLSGAEANARILAGSVESKPMPPDSDLDKLIYAIHTRISDASARTLEEIQAVVKEQFRLSPLSFRSVACKLRGPVVILVATTANGKEQIVVLKRLR